MKILQHLSKREMPSKVETERPVDSFSSKEPKPKKQEKNHSHVKEDVDKTKFKVQNIQQKVSPVVSKMTLINQPLSSIKIVEPSQQKPTGITEASTMHDMLPEATLSVKMPKMPIPDKMPVDEFPQVELKVSAIQKSTTSANPPGFKVELQGACKEHSSHSLERPSPPSSKKQESWTTPASNNFDSLEKVIIYIYQ